MKFKKTLLVLALSSPLYANEFLALEAWVNSLKTPNFAKIKDVNHRKTMFFNYLLPIIKEQNKKNKIIRKLIIKNHLNQAQLDKLAKKYRLSNPTKAQLLNAVDIIPASLVLAQAAIESNWGRSRFSQNWHNYFGIWCFKSGCGIVPRNRNKNAKHEVMQFASAYKAVEYYLLNLNRNHAYEMLRKIRAHKRNNQTKLTGLGLAEGLENYSGIGYEYIELVQDIIKQNNLARFD